MPFDWGQFHELAEKLKDEPDEASQRTAISRLYYAVYWKARTLLEADGFTLKEGGGTHEQVWREYKNKGGDTNKGVSRNGDILKESRVQADYHLEIKNLPNTVDTAFKTASNVIYYLKQIEAAKRKV
jgi:uncharacterized protein (UPF0332 family)